MHSPPDGIPAELRARDQWVLWRRETRDGKETKVPYQPNGRRAESDNPDTWASYEQVASAAHGFDGIGYVFAQDDPFTGADLDDCLENGELHRDAQRIVDALDSYTEWSPNGAGVHVIAEAAKPGRRCRTGDVPWGGKLEVYDQGRYFTVTGNRLPRAPATVEPRQAELDAVLAEFLPENNSGTKAPPRAAGNPHRAKPHDESARAEALCERYPDIAKLVAHRTKKPGDGTLSTWDYKLGCRAAEHELPDDDIRALIRHHRDRHDSLKGERENYLEVTLRAIRRRVPYPAESPGDTLAELTDVLDLAQQELELVNVEASGDGADARVKLTLSDGSAVSFDKLARAGRADGLATALAAASGVVTSFDPLQATRVVALIRRYVGRTRKVAEHQRVIELGLELLADAQRRDFTFTNQESRWRTWQQVKAQDPGGGNVPSAEAYAAGVLIPRDTATNDLYVRAGWVQEFCRRRGTSHRAGELADLFELVGWIRRGSEGRIKATEPNGDGEQVFSFYIVPKAWVDDHEATDDPQVTPGDALRAGASTGREEETASRGRRERHPASLAPEGSFGARLRRTRQEGGS